MRVVVVLGQWGAAVVAHHLVQPSAKLAQARHIHNGVQHVVAVAVGAGVEPPHPVDLAGERPLPAGHLVHTNNGVGNGFIRQQVGIATVSQRDVHLGRRHAAGHFYLSSYGFRYGDGDHQRWVIRVGVWLEEFSGRVAFFHFVFTLVVTGSQVFNGDLFQVAQLSQQFRHGGRVVAGGALHGRF